MVDIKVRRDGDYYIFEADRSGSKGLLHFTHETRIWYNLKTGKWGGDEINASGWYDFDEEEAMDIVKEYDLMSYIEKDE